MSPGRGAARLGRVALFSLTAVVLASTAHRAGGGSVPSLAAVAAVPAVMLVLNPVAGRRRSPLSLIVAMGALQTGLHYAFMTIASAAGCHIVSTSASAHSGHGAADPTGAAHAAAMACSPGMAHGASSSISIGAVALPVSAMTLLHAAAAVLLAVVLARGDADLWAVAAALGFRAVLTRWTTPPVPHTPTVQPISVPSIRLPQFIVTSLVLRRGPPMPAIAC